MGTSADLEFLRCAPSRVVARGNCMRPFLFHQSLESAIAGKMMWPKGGGWLIISIAQQNRNPISRIFAARRWTGGCPESLLRNDELPAGDQPGGGKVVPGFQLLDCRIEAGGNCRKRVARPNRIGRGSVCCRAFYSA